MNDKLSLTHLVAAIKSHPNYDRIGMILCHNGVVRKTSRDGRMVSSLKIGVDYQKLRQVVETQKRRPGIIEILVQINADQKLAVGDDVMLLLVAGDVRENVIRVMNDTLNAIKTEVTRKTEHFV